MNKRLLMLRSKPSGRWDVTSCEAINTSWKAVQMDFPPVVCGKLPLSYERSIRHHMSNGCWKALKRPGQYSLWYYAFLLEITFFGTC